MASRSKQQLTMAKRAREQAQRDKRAEKQRRKEERLAAAADAAPESPAVREPEEAVRTPGDPA
ncbi:MAG: hypothetical protein FJW96_17810 [Actinobacteria bacterium]|nr:hypothetical protein [Actinomycetota bacterium]